MNKNKTIFEKLLTLQKNAYAPYSKYSVAAISIDDAGVQYQGVNVENASFGLTSCAERNSIFNAISCGSSKIKEIHLICASKKSFGVPCGACRQVMAEFMSDDGSIYIYNNEGESKLVNVADLLPLTFRKEYFDKE